jgi:RNA ligase (TIGR02306 family)
MSKFSCPVVRVASVEDHFNADRLSIVKLEGLGYVCISAKLSDGSPRYKVGDWCVYIPSAAVLPTWLLKEMGFWNEEAGKGTLAGSDGNRVKPLKLRGVFSEGVLYPVEWDDDLAMEGGGSVVVTPSKADALINDLWQVELGQDVSEILGITKWNPPVPVAMAGEVASVAEAALTYNFERWESVPDIFAPDEIVVATEKLHGTCCIIQYFPDMDHPEMFSDHAGYRSITVSSKGLGGQGLVFKNNDANANNLYVRTLRKLLAEHSLAELLHSMSKVDGDAHPVAILGEVFGDMRIGREWLSPDAVAYWGRDLPCVPVLYTGPFELSAIEAVRDGATTVGGTNVREGVVVRSLVPSEHPLHGRRIAKFISPAYLTRKAPKGGEATEFN